MKILFLCGSVEPGRNGVGDYTRRLAGACIKQGHTSLAISLCDQQRSSDTSEQIELQYDGETPIPVVRIGAQVPWQSKLRCLESVISEQNPDLISLQYVPHGFHPKGLPFSLISMLGRLPKHLCWHLMLHELWTGFEGVFAVKRNAVSLAQRYALRRLIAQLSPVLVTTSNYRYRDRLPSKNILVLSLFSNIDPSCYPCERGVINDGRLHAVSFGAFSLDLQGFEQQLRTIKKMGESVEREPVLDLLGRRPPSPDHLDIARRCLGDQSVIDHGPLSEKELTAQLSKMHLGISRADVDLFPKSGSTFAMLEHGLPVLLRGPRGRSRDLAESRFREQLYFCNDDLKSLPAPVSPRSGVADTANKFLQLINSHTEAEGILN